MNISSRNPDLSQQIVRRLRDLFGTGGLLTDPADCWAYGYDNSRRQALPQAVVFAARADQISDLVALCNEQHINLVARGRGTGTTGATVPDRGGIVLSFERMDQIVEIDGDDRLAVVQPGVTNEGLQQALKKHGFFWPPDPTSAAVCTIGGNLAYNSAGPRAVKYGTPRDNTLGLEAVTGAGAAIRTGVRTSKGVVGYDLTRLLIGSEGTLAIITEATLKLSPLPEAKQTLQAVYDSMHGAAAAVAALMSQPVTPCALEFMDGAAIDLVRDYAVLALPESAAALLMIEVDGPAGCIDEAVAAVRQAASVDGLVEIHTAADAAEVQRLWTARKALSPALRKAAPKKINEDVVVPVSCMPRFIDGLQSLASEHDIRIVNFGHAGNGNIHVNLLLNPERPGELRRGEACLDAVFGLVLQLRGTLSGEHGVGLEKRDFVAREITPATLALMQALKHQFDPNGILNPGKGLPEPSSRNDNSKNI